jgi:hypothetical protein
VIDPGLHLIGGRNAKIFRDGAKSDGEAIGSGLLHLVVIDGVDVGGVVEEELEFWFFVDLGGLVQEESVLGHVRVVFLPDVTDFEEDLAGDTFLQSRKINFQF